MKKATREIRPENILFHRAKRRYPRLPSPPEPRTCPPSPQASAVTGAGAEAQTGIAVLCQPVRSARVPRSRRVGCRRLPTALKRRGVQTPRRRQQPARRLPAAFKRLRLRRSSAMCAVMEHRQTGHSRVQISGQRWRGKK